MQKNNVLKTLAELLEKNKQEILNVNKEDVLVYLGTNEAMLDRLEINENKISGMISSIQMAIKAEDPEGKILYSLERENGLKIENKTVPFGLILIIYESRPDITIEAAVTAFKAGNRVLLKGGIEARKTNLFLTNLWQEAFIQNGMDKDFLTYLDYGREEIQNLIKNKDSKIDLIIPRGGEGLIDFVTKNTSIPTIISGRGNNFLYIDKEVDFEMAVKLILNGKERISVCNALDKVLINQDLPNIKILVSNLVNSLINKNIEVLGDKDIITLEKKIREVDTESTLREEFLSLKIFLSLVKNVNEAIEKINEYSGGHSACIVTKNNEIAKKFQDEVDCAAVYHNSSVRFTDAGQFGLGTEVAISTQKLHSRGPIGVSQLVTNKWYIYGNGQIRE